MVFSFKKREHLKGNYAHNDIFEKRTRDAEVDKSRFRSYGFILLCTKHFV